jgi:hypothetical protein
MSDGLSLFIQIIRRLHLGKFILSFFIWYVIACFLLYVLDPSITSLGTAYWFGFILAATIGFGDYTVTAPLARLVAASLGLYGVLTINLVTGIVTSWFFEQHQKSQGQSASHFLMKAGKLDKLKPDELKSLAQQTKQWKKD